MADAAEHVQAVSEANDLLRHRGPDCCGIEVVADDAVLAFSRLAIIDIDIEHSDQPLDYLNRYTVTFNGEIFNYVELREQLRAEFGARFATDGDTEVLAAAYHYWGRTCSPGCAACSPS